PGNGSPSIPRTSTVRASSIRRSADASPRSPPRSPRWPKASRRDPHEAHMSWFDPWEQIEAVALNDEPVDRVLARAAPAVRATLARALSGTALAVDEAEMLLGTGGDDLVALVRAADVVREADVGDAVTYVVNRNINFTNVCFVNCQFCAFKRQRWEEDAYTHGLDVVLGKVEEAIGRGATEVREILSHKKVDVRTWVDIITTAHRLGVPTTSTVMYGHVETAGHVARHLDLMRRIQEETHGFTEFVPLGFIWENTKLYHDGKVTPQPKGLRDLRIYATCRLFLRGAIDNLQTSWVKLGHRLAQLSLRAGCNDFGGTLMEESISREAGADAGEYTSVEEIEALITAMGRRPVQRTTLYGRVAPNGHTAAAPQHA